MLKSWYPTNTGFFISGIRGSSNTFTGGLSAKILQAFRHRQSVGFAYQGKDIVLRFILEYKRSSLRDFGPSVVGLFFIWGFLKDDILACAETWDQL
jgi:hypothetical protein